MKIYELPSEIRQRVFELQQTAGNQPNFQAELINKASEGNFDWHTSEEGISFWKRINSGWYPAFYEKHPNFEPFWNPGDLESYSFSDYIILESLRSKDMPITLSEHSENALWQYLSKTLKDWGVDSLRSTKSEIEDAYKDKMRGRYASLVNLLDKNFPFGVYTKDADGDLIGIGIILTKFICEIAELSKEL